MIENTTDYVSPKIGGYAHLSRKMRGLKKRGHFAK